MDIRKPELIVMLTHNDRTVGNAAEVFEACRDSDAVCFGMKEEGLPMEELAALFAEMQRSGKRTFLEVVSYTEEEGLQGAQTAAACGCECLMGTMFSEKILSFCQQNHLKYMPFIGEVTERPSVLGGTAEEMIAEANAYIEKGAYGVDLLGYRYTGDAERLIREVTAGVKGPVCVAGSVQSFERIDVIREAGARSFTIGGAFFENRFGESFREQVNRVCAHLRGMEE